MLRTSSRITTTSTGNTSGCPQPSRAQRGALDGLYQGATEPAVFERGDARDGRAAGRRDHVLERARVHARLEDQARGAEHGLRREQRGGGAVETHLDPAVGQRLDRHRDIGRSGAGEPRHGVEGALVEHHHPAHGAEQLLRGLEIAGLEPVCARDGRDAFQNQGGSVGHDTDQARRLAEMLPELLRGHARRDGDQKLPIAHDRSDFLEDGPHDLGLDGQDDHVRAGHERRVVGDGLDAVALRDLLEMLRAGIGGGDGAGGDEASLGQALDQRLAHVTRAEECHPLALDAHAPPSVTAALGARGPKIAVPTRTMVAPSSIATSKSPLIPMEQCSSPAASRSSRSRLKNIRDASALSVAGGMHMSPRTSRFRQPVMASSSGFSSAGCTPPFCGSRPIFTCTSTLTLRSAWCARRSSSRASSSRSTEWIQSKSWTASLALLVWSEPIRCQGTGRTRTATLSFASCTRFSPSAFTPASVARLIRSISTVLETAITNTSSGLREDRRQARSTACWTFSRLSRMSSINACPVGRF